MRFKQTLVDIHVLVQDIINNGSIFGKESPEGLILINKEIYQIKRHYFKH